MKLEETEPIKPFFAKHHKKVYMAHEVDKRMRYIRAYCTCSVANGLIDTYFPKAREAVKDIEH